MTPPLTEIIPTALREDDARAVAFQANNAVGARVISVHELGGTVYPNGAISPPVTMVVMRDPDRSSDEVVERAVRMFRALVPQD